MNKTIEGNVSCIEDVLYARSNNMTHLLPYHPDYSFDEPVHTVLTTLNITVQIAVVLTNSLIWALLATRKSLRTTPNLLLLNLSTCNIISAICMIPYGLRFDIGSIDNSALRSIACSVRDKNTLSIISTGAYMFTLCTMSYSRFIAVRYPMKFNLMLSKEKVKYVVASFWLFYIGMISPFIAISEYLPEVTLCVNNYDKFNLNYIAYYFSLYLLGFIIPVAWLTISYVSTRITLGKRKKQWSSQMQEATDKSNQRAMATLKYLLLTFLICWLPGMTNLLTFTFRATSNCQLEFQDTGRSRIFALIASLNGLFDPIIYLMRTNSLKMATLRKFGKQAKDRMTRMTRRGRPTERTNPPLGQTLSVISTTA